jgi:hypothetical protein
LRKKFIFTQISGPLVGSLSGYAAIKLLLHFFSSWYQGSKVTHVIILGAIIILSCMLGMFMWGRFLVIIRLLSKKEAKGYPFSKPWESNENDQY